MCSLSSLSPALELSCTILSLPHLAQQEFISSWLCPWEGAAFIPPHLRMRTGDLSAPSLPKNCNMERNKAGSGWNNCTLYISNSNSAGKVLQQNNIPGFGSESNCSISWGIGREKISDEVNRSERLGAKRQNSKNTGQKLCYVSNSYFLINGL